MWVRELKRKTTKNVAVQIVRNYRNDQGKPRLKIVRHMGSAPEGPALEALVRVATLELHRLKEEAQPSLFPAADGIDEILQVRRQNQTTRPLPIKDARALEEKKRLCVGFHEVCGTLYDQMGFADVFTGRQTMARRLFKQEVLLRLAAPGDSKRAHARHLSKEDGLEVPVEKFYRMMDAVTDTRIRRLQSLVAHEVTGLLDGKVDVLFFDVTTLSFASDKEDALRKKGYSKDGKPHRVQVVLALIQTQQGLPIGYELFAGNTAEVTTLEPAIAELKQRFMLERVVFVADAGMMSKENLALLRSRGYDYVVAARMRSMGAQVTEQITGPQDRQEAPNGRKVAERLIGGQRLILRYCPKKAAKDAHTREEAIEKAKKRLTAGIKGKGKGGRFLQVDRGAVRLNEEAIEKDKEFDGLHGVWTSLEASLASPQQVVAQYRELWRIEEGFRVLKSTLAVRPIFHWTERRVQAHVAICFVAFAVLRILRYRYNTMHGGNEPLSEARILSELRQVETSVLVDRNTNNLYALPSAANGTQIRLYKAVGQSLQRTTVLLKEGTSSR